MGVFGVTSGGGAGGGGAPSGPAGGDLGGTFPDPTVSNDSHSHTQATLPPIPAIVYATANEVVNNSAALQTDDHLTVTLGAGKKYKIEIWAPFTDATASQAGGVKATIGGTATYTNFELLGSLYDQASVFFSDSDRLTAPAQEVTAALVATLYLTIVGTVEVNAGGTFFLRWAQASATSGDLTRLRGSYLTYQEIV